MYTLPPVAVLLLQWTLLLGLGWMAHALLRQRHPRWRLILWRSILCFGFALPLVSVMRLPRFNIPAPRLPHPSLALPAGTPSNRLSPAAEIPARLAAPDALSPRSNAPNAATSRASAEVLRRAPKATRLSSPPWLKLVGVLWLAGCGWDAIRLLQLHLRLRWIVRDTTPASASVQSLAWQIQSELEIPRPVRVRISDTISSPFLCGVFQPLILIPRRMAAQLSRAELAALLTHELAHERRHDVGWCIAWRLMRALSWFHPLVWQIPSAHVLACEEEADRVAARRAYEGNDYARLLAQLTLRVLRLPAEETPLALNATSHIARRLIRLEAAGAAPWRSTHSLAGFAVATVLLLLTAGWQFAQSPAPIATATILVTVQDENGRPIEGATLTPYGLRARGEPLRRTGYGWMPERHGPVLKVVTAHDGQARITYPVAIVPAEKIFTGEISFAVDHAQFAQARVTDYPVEGTAKPIVLKRGIPLRVAGHFGASRQPVADIAPHLVGTPLDARPEDWQHEPDGSLTWKRMTSGKHYLYLAGRLPTGEIVYSDGVAFFGAQREAHELSLELKPGIRVEGRLDARVARPIKNGWVQLSVHDDEADTRDVRHQFPGPHGNTGIWFSYRPVDADGRFVFDSVPAGELKVIAHGDGFISTNGSTEEPAPLPGVRIETQPTRRITRSVPQSFAVVRPVTTIEITTEPTATLRISAKAGNNPVANAKVHVWPNVIQMPNGSRVFGHAPSSSETPFREMPPLPEPIYTAVTNREGIALLQNLPAFTQHLSLEHAEWEVPLQKAKQGPAIPPRFPRALNRYIELALSPGQLTPIEVAVQPKGREFVGESP